MRPQNQLRHTRTRLRSRYALFPLEGYPPSVLPQWRQTEARVLTSPAMGADFVQYHLQIATGGGVDHPADQTIEAFYYVLSGMIEVRVGKEVHRLREGGFLLISPTDDYSLLAEASSTLLLLRKKYQPAPGIPLFKTFSGSEKDVPANVWMDIDGALLQTLIPEETAYDLAMNIFTFSPGYSLPVVETHVMEHGLYFLHGKGLYYLDEEWMEVEEGDFIWMGPYVPQSFYATGTSPAKYLYYKNVNREIPL